MKYQYIDFKSKNALGTNQYQAKKKWYKSTYWNLLFLPLVFSSVMTTKTLYEKITTLTIPAHAQVISPLPKGPQTPHDDEQKIVWHFVTPTPVPTGREAIADYIKEVFGDDADKAFQLLSCENSSLDPDIVNTAGNIPEGSEDVGVMQINSYWQGVNPRFLKNYKVNIQIGYQIYKESGNSFNLWACGQKLGI